MAMFAAALQTFSERWWAFFYPRCLVGFPWFWPARPPGIKAMVDGRRLSRHVFGRGYHPVVRLVAQTFTAIVWPPAVLLHLLHLRCVRGREAISVVRMPGAFWTAMRHNVVPAEYYAYELWRACNKANIDNYLYFGEACRIFKLINSPAEPDAIDDKLAFHDLCNAHGIPTPPVLAAITPTGTMRDFDSGRIPKRDLFIKPRFGNSCGRAEHLRWNEDGFEKGSGEHITQLELGAYIAGLAKADGQTRLVQSFLSNHPKLPVVTKDILCPVRLVTGRSPDGNTIPIYASFYHARHHDGNDPWPCSIVDLKTGFVQSGNSDGGSVLLPGWNACVEIALRAHALCVGYVFVGWDIALTSEGPMLLEGNMNWSAGDFQSVAGLPIGLTKFPAILGEQLALPAEGFPGD